MKSKRGIEEEQRRNNKKMEVKKREKRITNQVNFVLIGYVEMNENNS